MSLPAERLEELSPSLPAPEGQEIDVEAMYKDFKFRKRDMVRNYIILWVSLTALITWAIVGTGFTILHFFSGLGNIAAFIFLDLLPPDFSAFSNLAGPALESFYMAYLGALIAIFFSIFLGFMAANNCSFHPLLATGSRALIAFIRAVPALVIGIFFVGAFGLGALAGTLAIGISGIGILAKAYADILEEIDEGQVEAIRAAGGNWFQIMGQAVWPQFYAGFVAWSLYKMDLNIRESAILGMIGAGGLGTALMVAIGLFQYQVAALAILMIFVMILGVEYTTAKIREKII